MSNQLVGGVYQTIIEEVINSSRIDFEEAGINVSTLEDLKQVWQGKLSGLKIAQFPWDPPAPEIPQSNVTSAQARQQQQQQHHQHQHQQQQQQHHHHQHQHQQHLHQQHMQQQQQQGQPHIKPDPGNPQYPHTQNGSAVKIKSEPGLEQQGMYGLPPANLTGNPTHDPQLAAMRAQQNIAQKFGPQSQPRPVSGLVLPGMNPGPPPQQQRPVNSHNGIPQHDGGDDYDDEIFIEGFGSLTREEADRVLLKRIRKAEREGAKATEQLSQALQNLKVSSAKSKAKGKGKMRCALRMDAYDEALNPNSSYPYPSVAPTFGEPSSSAPRVPQLDGESGDEFDEDAINSDLDDPEEEEIDNDDEDEVPQIMLCMYDKVQRTKNKWKCVLKDGVLTINKQEFVFHKANGEYEW